MAETGFSKMLNRDRVLAMINSFPAEVVALVDAQVKKEAEDLAENIRRNVPVLTGTLRTTVRVEPGDRPLSYKVRAGGVPATRKKVRKGVKSADFAKAKAEGGFKGEYDYAMAVEFGHVAEDGSHVPAKPYFYPTYRARKKGMRRRVQAAARKGFNNKFDTRNSKG